MEVCTIGGFEEVGKNMTAVKVGEDVRVAVMVAVAGSAMADDHTRLNRTIETLESGGNFDFGQNSRSLPSASI